MFWCSRTPGIDHRTFIIDGDQSYSFNEIFKLSEEVVSDIPKRSVIVIESHRDLDTVCTYIGALRNGVVPLLVDANLKDEAVARIANSYQAEFVFGSGNRDLAGYESSGSARGKSVYSRNDKPGINVYEELCLLLPTSGSTGEAKCVRTSYDNLSQATQSIIRYLEMDESRVSISSLPLHYTYGLSVLNCALESRSRFVLSDKSWLEREFWSTVEKHAVTDLSGVPFMFQTLRRMRLSENILKNLKCVNQAGGRLEPVLTEYFVNYFLAQDISYFTMYGATEASPRISYVPYHNSKEKVGTVGIPIDIGRLSTDAADGVSEGELIYEGPNVCLGYGYNREDLTLGDENNQLLRTGDIGFIDEDGYATIVGRKKRFVKVFGNSVNLDTIESMVRPVAGNSVALGADDKVLVLITEGDTQQIKNIILENVTFPSRGLKVNKVSEIYMNASGKPDYPRMNAEFL
ncbi:MAG: AMP-binding protein [Sedimenticola sp.]|nr:AMP-binding protein [Sedimenticola sp.]